MMDIRFNAIRAFVDNILREPLQHRWSVQGFGMLRLYLTPQIRLHIWNRSGRREKVSDLHDHPWDFDSLVVLGRIRNIRYNAREGSGPYYNEGRIVCGPDPVVRGATVLRQTCLFAHDVETYGPKENYFMRREEIHRSIADDGTITIVERTNPRRNPDEAIVYWPVGEEWVSAEPREATKEDIMPFIEAARVQARLV